MKWNLDCQYTRKKLLKLMSAPFRMSLKSKDEGSQQEDIGTRPQEGVVDVETELLPVVAASKQVKFAQRPFK